jgi:ABC-type nitrate/sulfonate/bicarbonate transport system substrate-binding protein
LFRSGKRLKMTNLTLALDWTVNTNHSPFIVAQYFNYYKQANIDLTIINPETDNYAETPVKKVELGKAHFAICPTESLISYRTKSKPFKLLAVGTIFQKDASAIVALQKSGIKRPADLANKNYASYKAKYEDAIVQKMAEADGSPEKIKITYPEKLGIWETLLTGKADATWIFENWEGIEADQKDIALNSFKLQDYGIPYSYSPLIVCSEEFAQNHKALVKTFWEVTKKGFEFCLSSPEETAKILAKYVPEHNNNHSFLLRSQLASNTLYGKENEFGKIDLNVVQTFLNWLKQNGLESKAFNAHDLVLSL